MISDIQALTKKNPSWQKVFIAYYQKDSTISFKEIESLFLKIQQAKPFLSVYQINPSTALSFLEHQHSTKVYLYSKTLV